MAQVKVVSGFIPIPGFHRLEKYKELGERLMEAIKPNDALVFDDPSMKWEDTWLAQFVKQIGNVTHSIGDNPEKNTRAYHSVQHEKFKWLAAAAELDESPTTDIYVWIDYGIAHLKDFDPLVLRKYLDRAQDFGVVTMPGCWPKGRNPEPGYPCWRFCGGLIAVPRSLIKSFTRVAMGVAVRQIGATKNVEWEVNTLARLEQTGLVPMSWYQADHNQTLFTGAP